LKQFVGQWFLVFNGPNRSGAGVTNFYMLDPEPRNSDAQSWSLKFTFRLHSPGGSTACEPFTCTQPSIKAEHEPGQAACADFQVFGMNRPGIEPSLPALLARAKTTVPTSRWFCKCFSKSVLNRINLVNTLECSSRLKTLVIS